MRVIVIVAFPLCVVVVSCVAGGQAISSDNALFTHEYHLFLGPARVFNLRHPFSFVDLAGSDLTNCFLGPLALNDSAFFVFPRGGVTTCPTTFFNWNWPETPYLSVDVIFYYRTFVTQTRDWTWGNCEEARV